MRRSSGSRSRTRGDQLYNHVDGHAGLLRGLSIHSVNELAAAPRDAALRPFRADALRAIAHACRAYALQHPGRYISTPRLRGQLGRPV
ncbi:MAG TPA: hypothetical protein VNV42_14060 [Solirubrobacteraceae bacterium]|jgi:hypothetical protein|nr:hypothetical protein [Solirubrobacteraceae bacterium]